MRQRRRQPARDGDLWSAVVSAGDTREQGPERPSPAGADDAGVDDVGRGDDDTGLMMWG